MRIGLASMEVESICLGLQYDVLFVIVSTLFIDNFFICRMKIGIYQENPLMNYINFTSY